ncbi:MAG: hypothetical protein ACRD12_05470 [Acidimicrobiales bacterium]
MVVIGFDSGGAGAATYSGGATVVVKQVGAQALADVGAVVCRPSTDSGYGGACVPFGPGNAIRVDDTKAGTSVAFQVCIDNDGNRQCGGLPSIPGCADVLVYSHSDSGAFFNPIGPLPGGFSPGCPGGPFKGYVVLICQGVHIAGIAPHVHLASSGVVSLTTGGTGFGNFCGPNEPGGFDPRLPPKPYYII